MFFKRIHIGFFLSICLSSFSQTKKVDSLNNLLSTATTDSAKVEAFRLLFYHYHETSDFEKYKWIGEEIKKLGEKHNNDYWKGFGYRAIGDYLHAKQRNEEALKEYLISINYLNNTKEYLSLSSTYANLGGVYYDVYGAKEAAVYFKKALSILKTHNVKDISSLTNINNNLGICAATDKNYGLAKFYFKNALAYWIEAKDSLSMASGYNNIGSLFRETGEIDSAKVYLKKALDLKLRHHAKDEIIDGYINYGNAFFTTNDFKGALVAYLAAEKYIDSLSFQDKRLYTSIALTYKRLKDYTNGFKYLEKAYNVMDNKIDEISQSSFKNADIAYSDSLISAGEIEIKELKIANQNAQIDKGNQQKIFLAIGLVIVLVAGIMFYNRYKITKKQKEIIEEQKHLVEEQKKEIIDSINYANRIQNAVLTHAGVWQSISPQHFVLFKPKDIVSGDFYWAHQVKNKDIWAVADCTGHGVPGAFMSMLANSLLNEIVVEYKAMDAATILNRLRSKIIDALSKENNEQSDGMDIALCVYDRISGQLEFAGANNNAIIIIDGVVNELKGDKMPVGKYHGEEKPFSSSSIKLKAGDTIYLYTDGFADQFGGPLGKKFRYKQLDQLLLANQAKDMNIQRQILEEAHLTWKGGLIQTDDICIVGIRLS